MTEQCFLFKVLSAPTPPATWCRPLGRAPSARRQARGRHPMFTVSKTDWDYSGSSSKWTNWAICKLQQLKRVWKCPVLGHCFLYFVVVIHTFLYLNISISQYLVLLSDHSHNCRRLLGASWVRNITRVNNAVLIEIISCIYIEILREFD